MATPKPPQLGEFYKSHSSGVEGVVVESVPNKTGTTRLRLVTSSLDNKWTTFVPGVSKKVRQTKAVRGGKKKNGNAK